MTSEHRLFAILVVCLCLGVIAERATRHEGCLAICINNASAGAN